MILTPEDIEAIARRTAELLRYGAEGDKVRAPEACKILGVGRSRLSQLCAEYPEVKPEGKSSHFYSRSILLKLKRIRG